LVRCGIEFPTVPTWPIFEKSSHLREKGVVLMLFKTTPHLGAKAQYSYGGLYGEIRTAVDLPLRKRLTKKQHWLLAIGSQLRLRPRPKNAFWVRGVFVALFLG
jgi:hypothetical protein